MIEHRRHALSCFDFACVGIVAAGWDMVLVETANESRACFLRCECGKGRVPTAFISYSLELSEDFCGLTPHLEVPDVRFP